MMFGNLTIEEMQQKAGVQFPPDFIEFMRDKHQATAENIAPGKWHCFEIPFLLVCGDIGTAYEIHSRLLPIASAFNQTLRISAGQ